MQYIKKDFVSLEEVGNSMRIAFDTKSQVDDLQGYKKKVNNTWKIMDGYYFNDQYNMDTKETGAYLLAPRSSVYNQLDNNYNGMVSDLVNNYKLTEIFNSGELSQTGSKVYTYQIIAAIARVLGAPPSGYDTYEWLTEQGVYIIEINLYSYMSREEALYLLMQAYSKIHNMSLETMSIIDYNMIEDGNNISIAYKDVLLRGANYGIIPLVNGQLQPQEEVTIELILEMLTRIVNKIDW